MSFSSGRPACQIPETSFANSSSSSGLMVSLDLVDLCTEGRGLAGQLLGVVVLGNVTSTAFSSPAFVPTS